MTFDFFNTVAAVNLITVDTLADELDEDVSVGGISLREAVEIANASELPDLISFADTLNGETIILSMGELILNGEIFVEGGRNEMGLPGITIDANFNSRIFNIQSSNVAIEGVTLVNGQAEEDGGAIYAQADFDIANSVIQDSFAVENGGGIAVEAAAGQLLDTTLLTNAATNGGGLYVGPGSSAVVSGGSVLQNQAFSLGGGLYNAGDLNVLNSQIDTNQSEFSGGGFLNLGEARVESTNIRNNFGRTSGGGITNGDFDSPGILTVIASQIEDNSADFTGGGVNNINGDFLLADSTVTRNTVDFDGGGIAGSGVITNSSIAFNNSYEYGGGLSGTFSITNSAITDNTAAFGGGLLGSGSLSNSLVNRNTARLDGAGIQAGDLEITNSTISNNVLNSDFFVGAGLSVEGAVTLTNSIISGNTGGDDVSIADSGEITINGTNLVEDASLAGVSVLNLDPLLGDVADNGGSLPSQSLLPGSPAIDAGDNDFVTLAVDQRGDGFERVLDGNGDGLSTVDLGAFEAEPIETIETLYVTLKKSMMIQGKSVDDEDVLLKNQNNFSKVFDGSDMGLQDVKVTAFDIIGDNQFLMSFDHPVMLEGLGVVDDSDIVKFTATSLGEKTSGMFEMYFDGSDVGLTTTEEDIDGLTQLSNGDIIVSTKGNISAPGLEAAREDFLRFSPMSLGENTTGTWAKFLDMGDVELDRTNVDALHIRENGDVLLSTAGQFHNGGQIYANDDVFGFTPVGLGEDTTGSFRGPLLDGSQLGLLRNSIGAMSLG